MAKKTVQKFVEQAQEASSKNGTRGSGLVEMSIKVEQVAARRSIKRALVWLGFGLAFLALAFGDSWVTESPLFWVVGSGASWLFLTVTRAVGELWWFVTGSEGVSIWAIKRGPFGIQPYRSIAGIPVVFIVIASACNGLLWVCNRLPWFGKHRLPFLAMFRWGFWLLAVTAWLAALGLTVVRFVDSGRLN